MVSTAFYAKARAVFCKPIVTKRLSIVSADSVDAELLANFINADNRDFYTYASGMLADEDVDVEYVQETLLPFFREGSGIGKFQLYFADKGSSKLMGRISLWEDTEGRTRLSPYSLPSVRREGYTKEAYLAVAEKCREASLFGSLSQIWAEVSTNNLESLAFYKSMSFEECGVTDTPANGLLPQYQERFVLCRSLEKD